MALTRRQFLEAGTLVAIATAIAGCQGDDGDGEYRFRVDVPAELAERHDDDEHADHEVVNLVTSNGPGSVSPSLRRTILPNGLEDITR